MREAAAVETVGSFLAEATERLAAAGIESPRREARLILAHALEQRSETLLAFPERPLAAERAGAARALIERRCAREPYSRLTGEREFWGLPFRLSPATLDPRPDSETLVEAALAAISDRSAALRLVDFGCGSGCLLLALLSELPEAWGLGLDRSEEAARTARENARALGLGARSAFLVGDWDASLAGPEEGAFNLVLSNPPYIETDALAGLEPEVALHDPNEALDGGADGLDAYRALAPAFSRLLVPGGLGLLEIGAAQGPAVRRLLTAAGLRPAGEARDLGGHERCLLVRREEASFGTSPARKK